MYKQILVISASPWNNTNSSGNTFSNFFENWENANFFNIFLREDLPQNNVCTSYFQLTERQLLMKVLRNKSPGKSFSSADMQTLKDSKRVEKIQNVERKLLDFFRKNRSSLPLLLREFLWKIGGWKNQNLDNFLADNKFDCIFAFAAEPIYLQSIIQYCQRKTNAKLFLFFADDIYTHKSHTPLKYLYHLAFRYSIRKSVAQANKLYGASTQLCEGYKQYFNKNIEPLYKGCMLEHTKVKTEVSTPIKIVYAGNLYYGRWNILKALADEIEKINRNGLSMTLEIYTTATITPKLDAALNRDVSSKIMGGHPYDEIKKILAASDIVLHVESFEPKEIAKTRLSFSTKIIDCLQSGSYIMAIGPENISSIKYLQRVAGTCVITELSAIGSVLSQIGVEPSIILQGATKTYEFARQHHKISTVRNRLQKDFGLMNDESRLC